LKWASLVDSHPQHPSKRPSQRHAGVPAGVCADPTCHPVPRRSEEGLTYYRLLATNEKRLLKEDARLVSQARSRATIPVCLLSAIFGVLFAHILGALYTHTGILTQTAGTHLSTGLRTSRASGLDRFGGPSSRGLRGRDIVGGRHQFHLSESQRLFTADRSIDRWMHGRKRYCFGGTVVVLMHA